MPARPAASYRGARRNSVKAKKLLWREGRRESVDIMGGFRYSWHASMPQNQNGLPLIPTINKAGRRSVR